MKKKLLIVGLLVVILLVGGGVFVLAGNSKDEVGNLQIFKGSAVIVRDGQSQTGQTGTPVDNNDHIKAANNSTVALVLKDTTVIRLEAESEVEVTAVTYQNGKLKDAEFRLVSGRMWSRVQPLASGANFDVETPTVTAAVRGTSFNTTFKNHITGIYVYHHIVEVTLNSTGEDQNVNRTQLLQMKQSSVQDDFKKGPAQAPNNFYDAWIKFNMQQDDLLCQQRHDIPGDCGEPTGIPTPPTTIQTTTPQVAGENITAPTNPITNPKITTKPKTTAPTNPTPSNPIPTPPTVTGVTLRCFGQYFCSAIASWSNNTTSDVTQLAIWSTNPANYGTFSDYKSYKLYTRNNCSGHTISATYGGSTSAGYLIPNNCPY